MLFNLHLLLGILIYKCVLSFQLNIMIQICLAYLLFVTSLCHTANKAVETNEMWSLRSKEIEFDQRLKRKSREENSSGQSEHKNRSSFVKSCTSLDEDVTPRLSSSSSRSRNKRWQPEDADEEGLGDVEVKTFLQSR